MRTVFWVADSIEASNGIALYFGLQAEQKHEMDCGLATPHFRSQTAQAEGSDILRFFNSP